MSKTTQPGIPLDELRGTWDQVAASLEALATAWDAGGSEPHLARYVDETDPTRRRLLLIELIKADLEFRRAPGRTTRRVEEYLAEFPELSDDGPPCELLFEEFHLRKHSGEEVRPEEYYRRFPNAATELARLLGDDVTVRNDTPRLTSRLDSLGEGQSVDEFDLLRLLGKGSFARVFLAWQKSMHRLVALKVSTTQGCEPQALAQLDHPNIVHVYDRRTLENDGLTLLYMNYLPGGTLEDVIKDVREIPLKDRLGAHLLAAVDRRNADAKKSANESMRAKPLRRTLSTMLWWHVVCWMGARLAEGLDHAHRRGILHRDIKPANVLLSADGVPLLADFNVGASSTWLGADVLFGGSLGYMAPEHLEAIDPSHATTANSVDARSDLYSLAVTLWELLTGKRPFALDRIEGPKSQALAALLRDRRAGIAPEKRAEVLAAGVPEEMIEALEKCLAPKPKDRFARPIEFAQALDRCLNPDAQKLLTVKPTGTRAKLRRHPLFWVLLLGALPNLVGSVVNVQYNHAAVIADLQQNHDVNANFWFQLLILIINAAFFPFGIYLAVRWSRPIMAAVRRRLAGDTLSENTLLDMRTRAIRLPATVAWIVLACWATAGFTWPLVLSQVVEGVAAKDFVHFFASLVMCGLLAAVLTFFVFAWFMLRVVLPVLWNDPRLAELTNLRRLDAARSLYYNTAFAGPMFGVASITLVQLLQGASTVLALGTTFALAVSGSAAVFVAYLFDRLVRADIVTLQSLLKKDEGSSSIH
jgi:serine/threonine protein kinase